MSSPAVRTAIKDFIAANSAETLVDLTAVSEELKELLIDFDIQPDAPWLGIQFIGNEEIPVGLAANNVVGTYRETGSINIHVCAVAQIGAGAGILTRGEVLRKLFRGSNIGGVIIKSVEPMNTEDGATLQFEGGYVTGSFLMSYQFDFSL